MIDNNLSCNEGMRSMSDKKTVFVAGATGQQGGAAVEALLKRGHKVTGLTRNPDSDRARALASRGVTIVAGDFSDPDSLTRAAKGADTAYGMTTPFEAGTEAEVQQGIAFIEAAKAAGVGHIVLGSVSDANRETGIPHFDSKYVVEQRIANLGVPYSIVAPVYFMENLSTPWMLPSLQEGKLAMALPADRPLQQVAVSDIGAFVAALVDRREAAFGKRYDIAGDALTGTQTAAVIEAVSGREMRYEGFPPDALRATSEDMALMFEWFDRVGYSADVPGLRREFPDVPWHSLRDWAAERDWSALT